MILFCQNINEIPSVSKIDSLTKDTHLRLEFPVEVLKKSKKEILLLLKEKLPDYTVFMSSATILTIMPVVKKKLINKYLDIIINSIKDYIQISNKLIKNVDEDTNWENWELTYEHPPHNRYENSVTGQIVETCNYKMKNFKEIDPYFFGEFIQSSLNYSELKKLIKDTYHDTARILDVVKKTQKIQEYFVQEYHDIKSIKAKCTTVYVQEDEIRYRFLFVFQQIRYEVNIYGAKPKILFKENQEINILFNPKNKEQCVYNNKIYYVRRATMYSHFEFTFKDGSKTDLASRDYFGDRVEFNRYHYKTSLPNFVKIIKEKGTPILVKRIRDIVLSETIFNTKEEFEDWFEEHQKIALNNITK